MNEQTLKKICTGLLVLLLVMPVITTILMSIGESSEVSQYAGLQVFVMSVYNAPFVIFSFVALQAGRSLQTKGNENASGAFYGISIAISILGSILMLLWALGTTQ